MNSLATYKECSKSDSLEKLIGQIRHNNVILWVGAGLSKPLGYPLGSELLLILYDGLLDDGYQVTFPQNPSLQEISQIYEEIYGRTVLISRLSVLFDIPNKISTIHSKISQIPQFKHIITTNYDDLFEYAYRDQHPQVYRTDENYRISTSNRNTTTIYKIHGDFLKPDKIILTTEDYTKFDKESILWSNVRVLVAKNSILFLGYSLGDDNVIKMIRDIQERLEGGIRDMFIVTSNPTHYTNNYSFLKYPIHIISCSYDTAIREIEESIISYSLLDKEEGKLSNSEFISLISGKNIQISEILGRDGSNQIQFFPKSPEETLSGSISFKKPHNNSQMKLLIDLLNGKHFEQVMIDLGKDPGDFSANIEGIKLIDENITHTESKLLIETHPTFVYEANIRLSDNSFELNNIAVEHYINHDSGLFKLIFSHPAFKMVIQPGLESESLSINLTLFLAVHNINEGFRGFSLLERWYNGQDLIVMRDKFRSFSLPSYNLISDNPVENKKKIHLFYSLYSDIKEIQEYFNIFLSVPEKITLEHITQIRDAIRFIKRDTISLRRISGTFSKERITEHMTLFNGSAVIKLTSTDFTIPIFNKLIPMSVEVIGNKVQIANKQRLRNDLRKNKDPFIIFVAGKGGSINLRKIT